MYIYIYIHIYTDAHHTHIQVYPQPFIFAREHTVSHTPEYMHTLTVYRSVQQILLKSYMLVTIYAQSSAL